MEFNAFDKQIRIVKNKRYFLLGRDNDTSYWLEEPEWCCDWYWGFGYIHSRNWHALEHADNFYSNFFPDGIEEPELKYATFSKEEGWMLSELFRQFYILKEAAELFYLGHAGIKAGVNDISNMQLYCKINKVYIPEIISKVLNILTPENEEKYKINVPEIKKCEKFNSLS